MMNHELVSIFTGAYIDGIDKCSCNISKEKYKKHDKGQKISVLEICRLPDQEGIFRYSNSSFYNKETKIDSTRFIQSDTVRSHSL